MKINLKKVQKKYTKNWLVSKKDVSLQYINEEVEGNLPETLIMNVIHRKDGSPDAVGPRPRHKI